AARQFWPGANAVGRRVRLGVADEQPHLRADLTADGPVCEVVGVARDVRGIAFDGSDSKVVYLPLPADRRAGRPLPPPTQADASSLLRNLAPLSVSIDADLVTASSTLQDRLRTSAPFVISSISAAVASTLGLFGLLLASMGIYSSVAYLVVRRTR